jgi:MoxR-like ATPase
MSGDDFTRQAERAASALIMETGVRAPVESYELLHAVVAGAWMQGHRDAIAETVDALTTDAITDPSDAEIRL